ncbi:Protein ALP1-like [Frankliniella fusca]|uniref:Protein ALP1-like n=1 Tax=Frankliniella fusca TaxID=407009 RepID=A0AAE1HCQ8_9NEOP|nr:Protein ALP1-like [Frankliniella fusca]
MAKCCACKHRSERDVCKFLKFRKSPAKRRKWANGLRIIGSPGQRLVCSCHFPNNDPSKTPSAPSPSPSKKLSNRTNARRGLFSSTPYDHGYARESSTSDHSFPNESSSLGDSGLDNSVETSNIEFNSNNEVIYSGKNNSSPWKVTPLKQRVFAENEVLKRKVKDLEEQLVRTQSELSDALRVCSKKTEEISRQSEYFELKMKEADNDFQKKLNVTVDNFKFKLQEVEEKHKAGLIEAEVKLKTKLKEAEEMYRERLTEAEVKFNTKLKNAEETFRARLTETEVDFSYKLKHTEQDYKARLSGAEDGFQLKFKKTEEEYKNKLKELQSKLHSQCKELELYAKVSLALKNEQKEFKEKHKTAEERHLFKNFITEENISHYTGLPNLGTYYWLLSLVAENIVYYFGAAVRCLSREDQLFMTLFKLRRNISHQVLADWFKVSLYTVSNVILTWISVLHIILVEGIMNRNVPSLQKVRCSMPEVFRMYPNCRMIFDCTEVEVQVPSLMSNQNEVYSSYKSRTTFKALIVIAPNGTIIYVSDLFPGSTSDKVLVYNCGVLDLLHAGDAVMADKGFPIGDILPPGVDLNLPPFKETPQFTRGQVFQTLQIAKSRIHVERAILRVKYFHILDKIPHSLFQFASKVFQVCAGLTNLRCSLIREVEDAMREM